MMCCLRSSTENSGALRTFSAIATTTLSNMASARCTMSTCPLVIGSNEPGYTAMRWSAGMVLLGTVERYGGLTVTSSVEKRQGSVAIFGRAPPFMLGDEHAVAGEEPFVGDELERFFELAGFVGLVRRIEEDPAVGAAGLFDEPAHHGAALDVGGET